MSPNDRRLSLARPDLDPLPFGRETVVAVDHAWLLGAPGGTRDTELLRGEPFTVHEIDEDWAWGAGGLDGYVGYLPAAALADAPAGVPGHVVALPRTHLYEGANLKSPVVGSLFMGTPLIVTGRTGPWAETPLGFVWAGHCAEGGAWSDDAVATAERFLGLPYLWAGRSADGIDCSGLVQLALRSIGVPALRDSDMLAGQGRAVETAERGDVLCYKGHVAFARGDGTVVHATGNVMRVVIEPQADLDARARQEQGLAPDAPVVATIRRFR